MRVLVTGATGFLGRHLVPRLAERHEVVALVRDPQASVPAATVVVVADLRLPLPRAALPARVDGVIHLAQANVLFPQEASGLFAVNTGATLALLDYARLAGARRFVLASTGDVYGPHREPRREVDALAPASFYATTKVCAEALTRAFEPYLSSCALRLFRPYGRGQAGRLLPRLVQAIRERRPIDVCGTGGPRLTPTYVGDVVTAFERALAGSFAGCVNVAGDEIVELAELAERLGRLLGTPPVLRRQEGDAAHEPGDNSLMRRVLGDWPLVLLEEGLACALGEEPG
jgi:nucleoside-diphosphate-sugar epimerase